MRPVLSSVLVLCAVTLAVAAGRAVADEPASDERANGFACNADTLATQKRCYLEGEVLPSHDAGAQAKQNVLEAASLAPKACALASRTSPDAPVDADLVKTCVADFEAAAKDACDLGGATPLFDEHGRFAPAARACYDALGSAVRRTRTMAVTAGPCCRCLAKKCALDLPQCHRGLFGGDPPADVRACLAKNACDGECGNVVPRPSAPAEESLPPAGRPAPPGGWY